MQLSSQQFSRMLASLRPPSASAQTSEQRRHSRIRVRARVSVTSIGEDEAVQSYSALTSDISISGMALMQSSPVTRGSRLLVWLPRADNAVITLLCSVSRCATLADGLHCVGARFMQEAAPESLKTPATEAVADGSCVELTARQFHDVLATLREADRARPNSESRRYGRLSVQARLATATIDGDTMTCYSAMACDISIGGIGLYQAAPAKAGTQLLVRLPVSDKATLVIVCSVAFCNLLADGIFSVGAEFVEAAGEDLVRAVNWTDAPTPSPAGRVVSHRR